MRLTRYLSLFLIACIAGLTLLGSGCVRPPPHDQTIPVITQNTMAQAWLEGKKMIAYMSWSAIGVAALMQLLAFSMAVGKIRRIKRSDAHPANQLMQLEIVEVYFDLPLYFGLLGTVLAFILITLYPDAGLMFAYVSTALGIIVSVLVRLCFLVPFKQQLISQKNGQPKP